MGFPAKSTRPALALTILSLVLPAGALESDDRPLYYVMLKALESRFEDYNARTEADYERRIEALTQAQAERLQALDRERAEIASSSREELRALERRRADLDEATTALNEQIRDLHASWKAHDEQRTEHSVARGKTRLAAVEVALAQNTDTIRGLWRRYNAAAAALQASEHRLRELTDEIASGRHPIARTLHRLSQAYQTLAKAQNEALGSELAEYERRREDFETWRSRERRELARLDGAWRESMDAYGSSRSAHDRARDELSRLIERHNTLVESLNKSDAATHRPEAAVDELAALQDRIAADRARLERMREEALALLRSAEARRQELDRRNRRLHDESAIRERALAAEHTRLQGQAEKLRSDLAVRRRATQAQVRALEEQLEVSLQSARAGLEEQAGRFDAEFGETFPELFRATMAWLEGAGEPDPLYASDGSTP